MKIIHLVLGDAQLDKMNGINRVVYHLASEQDGMGCDVEVWGITPNPNLKYNNSNFKSRLFEAWNNKFFVSRAFLKGLNALPERTIFHLHGGFIPEYVAISKQIEKRKFEMILTPHGAYTKGAIEQNYYLKYAYFQMIERKFINRMSIVQCLGHNEEKDFKELILNVETCHIPNGQEMKALEDISGKFVRENNEIPVFCYCGRITEYQKGLDLLIHGFIKYKKKYNGVGELWLIGTGEYLSTLLSLADEHGLSDSVISFGPKFSNEKLNIISQSDAFFQPSRSEGLPLTALEAASLGVPLVVSEQTSMDFYTKKYHAGIVLKHNDIDEIASSMLEIEIKKGSLNLLQWGVNAIHMVENEFNWKVISRELMDVYKNL